MAPSLLRTDGYKFSMAEAGWPLRRETFYYSHRKGGAQVMPVDAAAFIRENLPSEQPGDYEFLATHEYDMGSGFKRAMTSGSELVIRAVPKGAIFYAGEPVFSVTGRSGLVSWLEPLLLQLNFRIQIATLARLQPEALASSIAEVTCEEQKRVVLETLDAVGAKPVPMAVKTDEFVKRVKETARGLIDAVGNPARIFEVGLRSVSCMAQHEIALKALKEVGVTRTSNVEAAKKFDMIPVGTMGHEHIQRYGSDSTAFRAMRDRRPYRSSYLLDTYDTLRQGLPAAYALIAEESERGDSIRFDSGDKVAQARIAVQRAREQKLNPSLILEDGLDVELTRTLEEARREMSWPEDKWFYGYGGYLVSRTANAVLTRDRVAAVYKLSQSGPFATMKFGDEAGHGKESHPGQPVVLRRTSASANGSKPIGIVAQEGEKVPEGYAKLSGADRDVGPGAESNFHIERSEATRALAEDLRASHFSGANPNNRSSS
jgi:nicotinic acid phosphoribosyltransferase